MAEVEAEGGRVSVVAKRHRISESLLYNWRSAWKAAAEQAPQRMLPHASPEFVQLGVIAPARDDAPMAQGAVAEKTNGRDTGLTLAERVGVIEIDLPDGVRIRLDGAVGAEICRRHDISSGQLSTWRQQSVVFWRHVGEA